MSSVPASPPSHASAAIIFLHGLGSDPSDWAASIDWVADKINSLSRDDATCKAVLPAAPIRAITKAGGEKMPAWFDVYKKWQDVPVHSSDWKDDVVGIDASVVSVHAEIERLVTMEGIPSERIIVGGFSQGAVLAFSSVYSCPRRLSGCLMLSGWIADRANVDQRINEVNARTPLFWGHGHKDDVVFPINQTIGIEHLNGCRGDLPTTARQYDIGHDANEPEMDDVLAFVKSVLL